MKKLVYKEKRKFSCHTLFNTATLILIIISLISCTKRIATKEEDFPEPMIKIAVATPTITLNPTATSTADLTATPAPDVSANGEGNVNPQAGESTPESSLRVFDQFIEDLKNGNPDQIVGLWVENIMALRVVYQPSSNPGFVSTEDEVATYFLYPWQKAGNHGLLAHNYLAGRYFFDVKVGDIITLVFGDGYYLDFEVTEIKEFQALQPDSPYSDYIDLISGEQLTVSNVFIEVYMGDFHTTLQTCIANGAETEWGRQFTIAPPL